ncbi:MAG: Ig-like domain-containing protein [Bacilli bacterium]|nr:Ig-like domain-containing protein [Bacilli bacterium]
MNRYIKLMIISLIAFISFILIGCDEEKPPVVNTTPPEMIEIYTGGGNKMTYYYGDEIQLAIDIDPYDASYDVIWKSSDPNIARVDENGLVRIVGSGEFTITATSKYDSEVFDSWTKNAYDNRGDLVNINEAKAYLDYLFPDGYRVNGVIELPSSYASTTITWTSSNNQVFSTTGLYTRQAEDVTVTLTAKISFGRTVETWSKEIVVGNINDVTMKNLIPGKIVMMYAYHGMHQYTAYELQYIDIINHAFALINKTTYKVDLTDIERTASDITRAHSYGVRVCMSIGGWGADGFSQSCASEETRAIFIASIIEAVQKYGYDGVDLDWEYPTSRSAGIAATTKDKANFTALCRELRAALDEVNPKLLLTAAVASGTSYYDVKNVDQYLNYWNLMTYDFSSKSSGSTVRYDEGLSDTTSSVNAYISAGATARKIIVGITFRATKFTVASLGSKYGVGQKATSNRVDIDYKDLVKTYLKDSSYKSYYDSTDAMAILYTPNPVDGEYIVITYENASSLQAKADLIKEKKIGGIMAWDLSMDSTNNEILKMVVSAVK